MTTNVMRPRKTSVPKFLAAVENPVRRGDAAALVKMMQAATGETPRMWGPSIIGFGTCHYVYDSGREGDMPIIGFSPRKSSLVLYITTGFAGAETLLARLGKHKTSKACLYVTKLADIDQGVLNELIVKSVAATRTRYA
jgi:hypothetical protein